MCARCVGSNGVQDMWERTIEHKTLFAELSRAHAAHVLPPRQRVCHQLLLPDELFPRGHTVRVASEANRAVEGLAFAQT